MANLTHGDAQDLLDRYKRALEARDVESLMSLYAPEAEHRDHPFREPRAGSNAIRAMWNDVAASQTHVEFDAETIWAVGATVLASWHGAYTDRTDGNRVRLRGFMTLELDEQGRVTRLRQWPSSEVVGKDSTLGAADRLPQRGGTDGG